MQIHRDKRGFDVPGWSWRGYVARRWINQRNVEVRNKDEADFDWEAKLGDDGYD